jgi:hypothetical protein
MRARTCSPPDVTNQGCCWTRISPFHEPLCPRTHQTAIHRLEILHGIQFLSLSASQCLILTTVTRRMRDQHTLDSRELRSQPPASMSTTSSQYYRSADAHSHYPSFPANDHEHLYALASWPQDPNHASYAGPPSAPFLHYPPGGADSVAHHSSAPQPWPSTYSRQGQGLQAWVQSAGNDSYTSRSNGPYDAAEGSTTVPHHHVEDLRQYQHGESLRTRQEILLNPPNEVYRNTIGPPELRTSSVRVQGMSCLALIRD